MNDWALSYVCFLTFAAVFSDPYLCLRDLTPETGKCIYSCSAESTAPPALPLLVVDSLCPCSHQEGMFVHVVLDAMRRGFTSQHNVLGMQGACVRVRDGGWVEFGRCLALRTAPAAWLPYLAAAQCAGHAGLMFSTGGVLSGHRVASRS
jgi:hypothetical protein